MGTPGCVLSLFYLSLIHICYQFKHAEMDTMLEKLRAQLQNKAEAK